MASRKLRPAPKKRTKRGPKLDAEKAAKAVELFRYWQETEKLRHP